MVLTNCLEIVAFLAIFPYERIMIGMEKILIMSAGIVGEVTRGR